MNLSRLPAVRREQAPEAPALTDDSHGVLSNAAFADQVEQYARHFAGHGVRAGDIVAVKLTNRVELVVALFAAWRLGAALSPVNPALTAVETRYQLQDCRAKAVVVEEAATELPDSVTVLTLDELAAPAPSRTALPELPEDPDAGADDLALVIYTSGTTGRPKGVELLHRNLDAMTAAMVESMKMSEDDQLPHSLLILPLFHVNGIVVSILSPLRAGGQATIMGRFSASSFFTILEKSRPTFFSGVPAMYAMFANLPPEVQPDTSSLRFVICGAAPMPPQLIEVIEKRYGVQLIEGYGLSEATCASTCNPLDGVRKPGTVGVPLPGQTVAIMGEDGELVTDGGLGEVVISGPTVMRGYLGRPEETAKAIQDGRLRTGDIGRLDEDGYLVLVDRVKDMIIRGGENIYPKEIETVLHDHPAVLEAAVVGRPDAVLGEVPVAFVSLRDGATATPGELTEFLAERLAPYKRPVEVLVVPAVPKNAVGKTDKPTLRQQALVPSA
ncbi:class I adenylate-forming enzyme family protein [Streptomyces sp. V3I7]|uniref:class I adenylate-forming enzyme family protein n=1 Tax=Streptomyces sp. V3I7 TaxID=3042278 RepID=UPI0027853E6C|nr:AMP-binding protein [Streptomyces sp. V3I7]MDQ0994591.1 long-chain acyl-CoA synthetase [Streptomyces sp. V3I7]